MKRKALNSLDFANNLILIPARSGSTRVRNKNIRLLGGKPLIAYAIEEALRSKSGRVIVSTNSSQIADISLQYGAEVPFFRPEELSAETASSLSALLHALIWFKENFIINAVATGLAATAKESLVECRCCHQHAFFLFKIYTETS